VTEPPVTAPPPDAQGRRPRTRPGGRPAPNSEPAPSYEALTQKAFLPGLRLISRPRGADRADPPRAPGGAELRGRPQPPGLRKKSRRPPTSSRAPQIPRRNPPASPPPRTETETEPPPDRAATRPQRRPRTEPPARAASDPAAARGKKDNTFFQPGSGVSCAVPGKPPQALQASGVTPLRGIAAPAAGGDGSGSVSGFSLRTGKNGAGDGRNVTARHRSSAESPDIGRQDRAGSRANRNRNDAIRTPPMCQC
jgi:hypothetical protein